jgi:hypothetical protein
MLEFEIAILKRVSHEYIIALKEVFETPKVRKVLKTGDHFVSD